MLCWRTLSALCRSAQFWASYSGYLREVRACSFIRIRAHEVHVLILFEQRSCAMPSADGTTSVYRSSQCSLAMLTRSVLQRVYLAWEIYLNDTLENISFLRAAGERELETARQMERWAAHSTVRCAVSDFYTTMLG